MQMIWAALQAIAAFFGFLKKREHRKELDEARQHGAEEARRKGSEEVDQELLDALDAKNNVTNDVEDIMNDPNNKLRRR